jgi:crossover junction endodeoxyribonuclease RusA
MTKTLILEWPDMQLSPNKRRDLRALTWRRQRARTLGFAIARDRGLALAAVPLRLRIEFSPPDRRRRDLDNLYSAFKAYQDGIFQALDLDDSLIASVELVRCEPVPGGEVRLDVAELA